MNKGPARATIIGAGLNDCLKLIQDHARCDHPVLIVGDTGTGKELLVRAYMKHWCFSPPERCARHAMLNCTGVPDDLLTSELFGTVPGAFTDASKKKRDGLIQEHDLVCLDELGDSSDRFQAELLRLVETGDYRRVGASTFEHWDGRCIASTNRPERIRQDLAFRFHRVDVPRLAARRDDIPALVLKFGQECHITEVTERFVRWAATYHWPGNVRELLRCIQEGSFTGTLDLPRGALTALASRIMSSSTHSSSPHRRLLQVLMKARETFPLASFEERFRASADPQTAWSLANQELDDQHDRGLSEIARLTREVGQFVSYYRAVHFPSRVGPGGATRTLPLSPADEAFIRQLNEAGSMKAYAEKTGEEYGQVLGRVREIEKRTGMKRGKDFLVERKRRDR